MLSVLERSARFLMESLSLITCHAVLSRDDEFITVNDRTHGTHKTDFEEIEKSASWSEASRKGTKVSEGEYGIVDIRCVHGWDLIMTRIAPHDLYREVSKAKF